MPFNGNEIIRLKDLLDEWVDRVNVAGFIQNDPVLIPHSFTDKQDIEIAGFFAAILAWGQRKTIISKSLELMSLMDNVPYSFITGHTENDLKPLANFVHRTFQTTDLLYFIQFLQKHYKANESLQTAFHSGDHTDYNQQEGLIRFHQYFFDTIDAPARTQKHIATPARNSTCKRLNMYLRWMVRKDDRGVDLGIWDKIPMSGLMMPLDVHVENNAKKLGILMRKQRDWHAVVELTSALRLLDADDPVKYDYALFGMGVTGKSDNLVNFLQK